MTIKKILRQVLHLNAIRKIIGWNSLNLALKGQLALEVLNRPIAGKVLLLSPHPDDDVIGSGGTLALHQQQSDNLKIVYLFNGQEGKQNGSSQNLAAVRQSEALAGLKILGIKPEAAAFWDIPDGELIIKPALIHKLKNLVESFSPRVIYLPHPSDNHPDHQAVVELALSALALLDPNQINQLIIWSYEVWQPTLANRLIKIDSVAKLKQQAIHAHQSQLQDRPYDEATIGLNRYRGGMFGQGLCEGYLVLPAKLYLKLYCSTIQVQSG